MGTSSKDKKSSMFSRREVLAGSAAILGGLALPRPSVFTKGEAPYNAEGERTGEVTHHSAIVHTRLTAHPTRNNRGHAFPWWTHNLSLSEREQIRIPEGMAIADLEGECPGKGGMARLLYGDKPNFSQWIATDWVEVGPDRDFTQQFLLEDLNPSTLYNYRVELRSISGGRLRKCPVGKFQTAPAPDEWQPVKFFATTCQDYACRDHPEGYHTYESMIRLGGDFIVSTGDSVYYDLDLPVVHSKEVARFHWHRMFSQGSLVRAFQNTAGYWLKDDHDSFEDDDWPTRPPQRVAPMTYQDLAPIFLEQVPMGKSTYRKVRWGPDLEIWFVENRDFRSPNPAPDGPRKTIWGKEQKEWLIRTLKESDARYRLLVSPDCIVGPDLSHGCVPFKFPDGGADSQCDCGYGTEGFWFRRWVKENIGKNFAVINGDRHWQYHSIDPDTGVQEFSCGAVTDSHSVVVPKDPRYNQFLRCKGGFISVSLDGTRTSPVLTIRHHDVMGSVVNEVSL